MLEFLITALAVFRVSALLTSEAGPYEVFKRLRQRVAVLEGWELEYQPNLFAGILSCIWCCSVWVGGFFSVFPVPMVVKRGLALSTAALVVNATLRRLESRGEESS